MRKLILFLIGLGLIGCDAKNSNVATKENQKDSVQKVSKPKAPVKRDTMTVEEAAVAAKVGAFKVHKLAEDTFKIVKKVAAYENEGSSEGGNAANGDSVCVVGVVSAAGKYYVPAKYTDVHQIGRDAFVAHLSVDLYDYNMLASAYTEVYKVIYQGKEIGQYTHTCEIRPIAYKGKIAGFLKIFYDEENNCYYLYYINTRGQGWDGWLGVRTGSYPRFEQYKVEGNVLTLWGGAKTPEDVRGFFPEDRSLYRVDLHSGRVLENPFVPTD